MAAHSIPLPPVHMPYRSCPEIGFPTGPKAPFWSLLWQPRVVPQWGVQLPGWPGCRFHKGLFCGSLFGAETKQYHQGPRRTFVWSRVTYTDFVKRVVGLPPAHSLSVVVEQLVASCRRTMSLFVSGLLFCSNFLLLPFLCLPVVKREGLHWSANAAEGPAGRDAAQPGTRQRAPPLQPLREEVEMSRVQLSWKAVLGWSSR